MGATALLLIAGGLVTGREAGLAVKDWPTTSGYNMFLYPLARMTGNIYYEHAHRLYGALVGLTTLAMAFAMWRSDRRVGVRVFVIMAVLAVCLQGYMGGRRVTSANTPEQGVEVARVEHETQASASLRVAHGVFGQIFFAMLVGLTVVSSPSWHRALRAPFKRDADHVLAPLLVSLLLGQLILGALVRHLHLNVMLHIGGAGIVFPVAIIVGLRAWTLRGETWPVMVLSAWLSWAWCCCKSAWVSRHGALEQPPNAPARPRLPMWV